MSVNNVIVIERNNRSGHVNKLVFVLKTDRKPSTEQSPGERKCTCMFKYGTL